ncbi:hypothetical protein Ccrd_011925 [Cynara cardunculus var. scolymus]|uniref:Uncharacterized protein n=1 Tax=Cynara cardunculus var. scolymus TaxID=59895 RepID=A0A103YIG6_CYNCS|nr:hypothetical protein Ccrd_011925 [Cynara cardunculus var. scolymus]
MMKKLLIIRRCWLKVPKSHLHILEYLFNFLEIAMLLKLNCLLQLVHCLPRLLYEGSVHPKVLNDANSSGKLSSFFFKFQYNLLVWLTNFYLMYYTRRH